MTLSPTALARRACREPAKAHTGRPRAPSDGVATSGACAPVTSETAELLAILGPQQPLTTFGADAGVLRMSSSSHRRFRHVRDSGEERANRLHVTGARARPLRASLEITLPLHGLVLALSGAGLVSRPRAEARKDDDVGHLTEALSRARLWRWNLRAATSIGGTMYRLLGPVDETMAFRTDAQSLHPTTTRASTRSPLRGGKTHAQSRLAIGRSLGGDAAPRTYHPRQGDRRPLLTAIAAAGSRRLRFA